MTQRADPSLWSTPGEIRIGGIVVGALAQREIASQHRGRSDRQPVIAALDLFCRIMALERPAILSADSPVPAEFGQAVDDVSQGHGIRMHLSADQSVEMADAWFVSDRDLRMRLRVQVSAEQATLRLFQFEPAAGRLLMVGEAAIGRSEIAFVQAALLNPYMPVLTCMTGEDGVLLAASVLPFPTFCRGGLHYAELCATGSGDSHIADLQAVSRKLVDRLLAANSGEAAFLITRFGVDIRGATGAEPVFSHDLREWLAGVMGVALAPLKSDLSEEAAERTRFLMRRLSPAADGAGEAPQHRRNAGKGATLVLPYDSIPSIHALVALRGDAMEAVGVTAASFVTAEAETNRPRWSVKMPSTDKSFLDLQPRNAALRFPLLQEHASRTSATASNGTASGDPVAVRFVDGRVLDLKASLMMPVAPEIQGPLLRSSSMEPGAISVLVPSCGHPDDGLVSLVQSLRLQSVADAIEIVAVLGVPGSHARARVAAILRESFDGRFIIIDDPQHADRSERLDMAAAKATGTLLVVAESNIVLHDPRTLKTLAVMAVAETVASAGCMIVRHGSAKNEPDVMVHAAGCFPVVGRHAEPLNEGVAEIDCYDIFPLSTYPVAANACSLQMMKAGLVARLGGFAGPDDNIASRAVEAGLRHMCTSVISAGIRLDRPDAADRLSPRGAASARALSESAVLGRLNG